jgi:hypothetical protein
MAHGYFFWIFRRPFGISYELATRPFRPATERNSLLANYAVVTIIVLSIILIALLQIRPFITAAQGGKIIAFIAFFILPIVATVLGASIHLEQSTSTQFCLSCHVMEAHGKSLYIDDPSYLPAAHFQNNRIPKEQACFYLSHRLHHVRRRKRKITRHSKHIRLLLGDHTR